MMSDVDRAWLVGLFEGEGCIGLLHKSYPTLIVSMSDEDVIRRAHAVAGVGRVSPRRALTKSGKRMWSWWVGRCDDAAALIETMLPLLGRRRSARARQVLDLYRNGPVPKRLRTHCKRGHPYSGDNLRIEVSPGRTPRRGCKACSVINTQSHRDRYPERARESLRRSRAKAKIRKQLELSGDATD